MRTQLLIAFAIFISLLNPSHAVAQSASAPQSQSQTPAAIDDEAAIRHVAELYMSFEPAKLREGFYTQSNLYVAGPQGELRVIPLAQFLENVAKGEVTGRKRPVMQIDMTDHVGTAAVVKITERSEEATVTDYLSLIRSAEGWKVVAKSFYVDRKPHASADTSNPNTDTSNPSQRTTESAETFAPQKRLTPRRHDQ